MDEGDDSTITYPNGEKVMSRPGFAYQVSTPGRSRCEEEYSGREVTRFAGTAGGAPVKMEGLT